MTTGDRPGRSRLACGVRAALLALALGAAPAAAQTSRPQPWLPPHSDSLTVWAARARGEFKTNAGDSVGGDNYLAYQDVARMGRFLIETLGRANMRQAYAIEPVFKDQGLDVDLRIDPRQPEFMLLMVHDPYHRSAASVGFVYWWKVDQAKFQGAYFRWGRDPRFRVWWSGTAGTPYLCGIIEHPPDATQPLGMLLLSLSPDATHWGLLQYPGSGPELGVGGSADWYDVNSDGVPELVEWLRAPSDSTFSECTGCPGLRVERVFTLQQNGFELEDSRLVGTPYATFQLFIRMLKDRNRTGAMRLVARPTLVDSALAEGWGSPPRAHEWLLARVENGDQWPRWLDMSHGVGQARSEYAVHFAQRDGRWVISHWVKEKLASLEAPKPAGAKP